MYDMLFFGKICVEGLDVMVFMNYIGGGDYDVFLGKIVYMQFLNYIGGIEVDVIVICLLEIVYIVVILVVICLVDQIWMMCYKGDFNVVLIDVIVGEGVLVVMGLNVCKLLEKVLFSNFLNVVNFFGIV